MGTGAKLRAALVEFLAERGRVLADGPLDNLSIPLSGGEVLLVPVVLLQDE